MPKINNPRDREYDLSALPVVHYKPASQKPPGLKVTLLKRVP